MIINRTACISVVISALLVALPGLLAAQKSASYIEVVKQAPTALVVASSANLVTPDQSVQFTATVSPLLPTVPTGNLEIVASGTNSNKQMSSGPLHVTPSGIVTWTPSFSVTDQYSVVASYSGDSNYSRSVSQSISEIVQWPGSPDFTVGLPTIITVVRGKSISATATVTPVNGFSGAVTFTCNGAPDESTCTFVNGSVVIPSFVGSAPPATSQTQFVASFTVTTAATTVTTVGALFFLFGLSGFKRKRKYQWLVVGIAILCLAVGFIGCAGPNRYVQSNGTPVGSYPLTIIAKSGTLTHTSTVTLNVVAQ